MAPTDCPKCGGPNIPGRETCQWCSSPLPRLFTPAPITQEYRPLEPPPAVPAGPNVGGIIGIVVFAIVALVILGIVLTASTTVTPPSLGPPGGGSPTIVDVSAVYALSLDDACGLNGANQAGFVTTSGETVTLQWDLPATGAGHVPCTVSTVSTNSPGFSVSASLPFTATASGTPLNVGVDVPQGYYDGILNVTFG